MESQRRIPPSSSQSHGTGRYVCTRIHAGFSFCLPAGGVARTLSLSSPSRLTHGAALARGAEPLGGRLGKTSGAQWRVGAAASRRSPRPFWCASNPKTLLGAILGAEMTGPPSRATPQTVEGAMHGADSIRRRGGPRRRAGVERPWAPLGCYWRRAVGVPVSVPLRRRSRPFYSRRPPPRRGLMCREGIRAKVVLSHSPHRWWGARWRSCLRFPSPLRGCNSRACKEAGQLPAGLFAASVKLGDGARGGNTGTALLLLRRGLLAEPGSPTPPPRGVSWKLASSSGWASRMHSRLPALVDPRPCHVGGPGNQAGSPCGEKLAVGSTRVETSTEKALPRSLVGRASPVRWRVATIARASLGRFPRHRTCQQRSASLPIRPAAKPGSPVVRRACSPALCRLPPSLEAGPDRQMAVALTWRPPSPICRAPGACA